MADAQSATIANTMLVGEDAHNPRAPAVAVGTFVLCHHRGVDEGKNMRIL